MIINILPANVLAPKKNHMAFSDVNTIARKQKGSGCSRPIEVEKLAFILESGNTREEYETLSPQM